MPRLLTKKDDVIRARWAAWLSGHLAPNTRVKLLQLDRVLGETLKGDHRGAIHAYKRGERTPSAQTVFEVGEALSKLKVPLTSGLVALYAAGYFAEAIDVLVRLSQLDSGAKPALSYYISLPLWFDLQLQIENLEGDDRRYEDYLSERMSDAQSLAQYAIQGSKELLGSAWANCQRGSNPNIIANKAMKVAEYEPDQDNNEAADLAWKVLLSWARKLFINLGGTLGDYPLFKPRTLFDLASPPLDVIRALRNHTTDEREEL